jgi:hypothetical protein
MSTSLLLSLNTKKLLTSMQYLDTKELLASIQPLNTEELLFASMQP